MEEIVSTEALEKEILEDARKKGERLLKDADAEIQRLKTAAAERSRLSIAALEADYASRLARYQGEAEARLPLELGRMKAAYVDALLRDAAARFALSLSAQDLGALVSSLLARASSLLGSTAVHLCCMGLDPAAASGIFAEALPQSRALSVRVDEGLSAPGLVATSEDGRLRVRATLDLVTEALLGENRGELARALCAEALAL
jgi:V/A-type H+-transporting ATPase subunit E